MTDARHLACSQTRMPIAQTSSGPTGSVMLLKVLKFCVARFAVQIIPPAATRLPIRDSKCEVIGAEMYHSFCPRQDGKARWNACEHESGREES